MEQLNFNTSNKDYLVSVCSVKPVKQNALTTNPTMLEKIDNKKIKLALLGLAATGAAITAGVLVYKGKTSKLSDVTFDNGKALTNSGDAFSGIIKDKLPNGDSIKLKYENGILLNSKRSGSVNFSKSFKIQNGDKIATTVTSEGVETTNITKIRKEALDKIAKQEKVAEQAARIKAEQAAKQAAKQAQREYNAPFENALSNKSAEESALVFQEDHKAKIKKEAIKRLNAETKAEMKAKQAQREYNAPFEKALSNKSAEESADTIFTRETKNSRTTYCFDNDGNITERITKIKNGDQPITIEYLDNENVTKRVTRLANHKTNETVYHDNKKIITMDDGDRYGNKIFIEQDGKLKLLTREHHDILDDYHKTVEHFGDGTSKTTVTRDGATEIIFRDKKGNIINVENKKQAKSLDLFDFPQKPPTKPTEELKPVLDNWYIDYLALCKKYNEAPRPCGVKGGAMSHLYELEIREKGPEAWKKYLELEKYRAEYDGKARLMQNLRSLNTGFSEENIFKKLGFSEEDIKILMNADAETLNELVDAIKYGEMSVNEIMIEINKMIEHQSTRGQKASKVNEVNEYLLDLLEDCKQNVETTYIYS